MRSLWQPRLSKAECFHLSDFELSAVAKSFCFAESLFLKASRTMPQDDNEWPQLRSVITASDGALAIKAIMPVVVLSPAFGP